MLRKDSLPPPLVKIMCFLQGSPGETTGVSRGLKGANGYDGLDGPAVSCFLIAYINLLKTNTDWIV